MGERHLLTGNHAASYGAKLARAEVISAYPITPQTTIVELLSEMVASGELDARYITVESEHSAMAAVIGSDTVPTFPRKRNVVKSRSAGMPMASRIVRWWVAPT